MSVNIRNPITGELTNASGGVINPKSINEMIAPIEDGTASKAYVVGEQFIMNDLLCEATQAIAQGDTMVIGTNCEESEQLSKQVKDIKSALGEKEDVLPTTATKSNIAEITTFSSAKKSFTIPLNAKYLRVSIKIQDVHEAYSPFIPVEIVKAGLMASSLENITFASKNTAYQLNLFYYLASDGITPYTYESGGNLVFQWIRVYAY